MDTTKNIAARLKQEVYEHFPTAREFIKAMSEAAGRDMREGSMNNYLNGRSRPGTDFQELLDKIGIDSDYIMTGRRPNKTEAEKLTRGKRLIDITVPTDATLFETETEAVEGGVRVRVYEAVREVKKIQPMLEDEAAIILRTPRAAEGKTPYLGSAAATPPPNGE